MKYIMRGMIWILAVVVFFSAVVYKVKKWKKQDNSYETYPYHEVRKDLEIEEGGKDRIREPGVYRMGPFRYEKNQFIRTVGGIRTAGYYNCRGWSVVYSVA